MTDGDDAAAPEDPFEDREDGYARAVEIGRRAAGALRVLYPDGSSLRSQIWRIAQGVSAMLVIGGFAVSVLWVLGVTPWQVFWGR